MTASAPTALPSPSVLEINYRPLPGTFALLALLLSSLLDIALFIIGIATGAWPLCVLAGLAFPALIILWQGLFAVSPNEAKVLQLFGAYVGTVREPGLKYANPFFAKKSVSLKVRNFESNKLKVNDHDGSPIEIAAVIVWRVVDSAEAVFEVDNYAEYVHVQAEAALRNLATQYPYDAHLEGEKSLRGSTADVAAQLRQEMQGRLAKAGVEVLEARISHLAYAPEIAAAMLRRQQAGAVIAARSQIVAGAVGMVELALADLEKKNLVDLDPERKAQMVSNLLVVLCSEHDAAPVINTGTLYQ
jgi:regulator of protease activity HflC (stomatin/prohibitin superfamily)